MVALMGFEREQLEAEIESNPEVVIANDNNATQVVISGTPAAVEQVLTQVKVKRAMPLKVSGAFHSPMMAEAARDFQAILTTVPFADGQVPVLSNVDPTPEVNSSQLQERLSKQMTSSVRWREIMLQLPELDVTKAIEVGPGKVLAGLLKRTCRGITLENFSNAEVAVVEVI